MLYGETISEVLLKILLYKTLPYKEVEKMFKKHKTHRRNEVLSASIRNTLTRLKKAGLISNTQQGWSSGKFAEKYLNSRKRLSSMNYVSDKVNKNRMVITYDVPENFKRERDWLRGELRILGFIQKQKSVWIGPSPLPKEFVDRLIKIKVIQYLNFFNITEKDIF